MAKLSEAVKLAAAAQNNASKPTAWMFGEVLSPSPLRIRVEDRFEIGAEQIVLLREFVAGQYATHTHSLPPHTHMVEERSSQMAEGHTHLIPEQRTGETPLQTAAEVYTGLLAGDKVVLLQNAGGQKFLVLGRV